MLGVLRDVRLILSLFQSGITMEPNISRITIIIDVENLEEVEQIIKQLNRLIDVLRPVILRIFLT